MYVCIYLFIYLRRRVTRLAPSVCDSVYENDDAKILSFFRV